MRQRGRTYNLTRIFIWNNFLIDSILKRIISFIVNVFMVTDCSVLAILRQIMSLYVIYSHPFSKLFDRAENNFSCKRHAVLCTRTAIKLIVTTSVNKYISIRSFAIIIAELS